MNNIIQPPDPDFLRISEKEKTSEEENEKKMKAGARRIYKDALPRGSWGKSRAINPDRISKEPAIQIGTVVVMLAANATIGD